MKMRAKLWFRCAVVHDPVCPKITAPAAITWEAKYRDIDLVIERKLKGDELVRRMKGWVTVDPYKVIETVSQFGKFVVDKSGELFVELSYPDSFDNLKSKLYELFGDEIIFERLSD
jgi:hypothetical protein